MEKYIVGNWKMNGSKDLLDQFFEKIDFKANGNVLLCVPFVMLNGAGAIGAEDCSANENGAFTGEISAKMLADIGVKYCIVGHSERRQYWHETSELVAEKAMRCIENNIIPIICVGETKAEKDAGDAMAVIADQIAKSIPAGSSAANIIVAYEPVWAIGTGLIPTTADIKAVHDHIAALVPGGTAVLYGGSVKPSNAREILEIDSVGGVLVGGASLDVEQFSEIINARK